MIEEYFDEVVGEMVPEDIDNNFFRIVANDRKCGELSGAKLSARLILLFEDLYPNAKEGQRKISVPLKSTFIFKANKRRVDGGVRV